MMASKFALRVRVRVRVCVCVWLQWKSWGVEAFECPPVS